MRKFFKETYSGVYSKGSNSWIQSTYFKPFKLTLIFQCGINSHSWIQVMFNVNEFVGLILCNLLNSQLTQNDLVHNSSQDE